MEHGERKKCLGGDLVFPLNLDGYGLERELVVIIIAFLRKSSFLLPQLVEATWSGNWSDEKTQHSFDIAI